MFNREGMCVWMDVCMYVCACLCEYVCMCFIVLSIDLFFGGEGRHFFFFYGALILTG